MRARQLCDSWPDMPSAIKDDKFLEVRALVITMHYSLKQAQLQIPGETLRDVRTNALTDKLPDTLAAEDCSKE